VSHSTFTDTAVIYRAEGRWIAHGLHTDQIGVGDRIVDALADYFVAVDQVLELAREDETIAYRCEAPPDIQMMLSESEPLPAEIYEVAHKIARGVWPKEWDPPQPKRTAKRFRADYHEQPITA
jgi:hypothetical protein